MENNEKMDLDKIVKELVEKLVNTVCNETKAQEEAKDKVAGEVVNDVITVGNKSAKDEWVDWEAALDDWENKVDDLEDTNDAISQRDNYRYSKRKSIPTRKSVSLKRLEREHRINKRGELEDIKDNIKEDRANLFKLLHSELYRDIEELRKICTNTDMYRKRFDQDDSWFVDNIDGTMDALERSGRDYMELIDSLVSCIDDLITKIDNGEIK